MKIYEVVAPVWDICLSATGFKRGLENFIKKVPISAPRDPRMLDIGCGTGITSFALLERFPGGTVIATDLDHKMLEETERIGREKALRDRLSLAQSDVNAPHNLFTYPDGSPETLEAGSFDIVVASGVLEYADLDISIPAIVRLLKPGGTFLSISMNGGPIAKVFKHVFSFTPVDNKKLLSVLRSHGCSAEIAPFGIDHFSANFTRVGVIAVKGG